MQLGPLSLSPNETLMGLQVLACGLMAGPWVHVGIAAAALLLRGT